MPIVTSGLYRVTFGYLTSSGNPAYNVLYYHNTLSDDTIAEQIWGVMDTVMVPLFQACHYAAYLCDNLKVEPIFSQNVPYEAVPTSQAGTLFLSGDPLPGHIAASIRLFRSTRETRSGWKRVSGFSEGYIAGNTISSDLADALNALATGLGSRQTVVGYGFIDPVLVRPPGTYAAGVQTGWVMNPVSSASAVLNRVTTQNSRKNW